MALKATIFKAELELADLDRGYYASHTLTLARHPSETDARMMVRLVAFALHADPALGFTRGLCSDDEPELWLLRPSGEIALWIELGQPDIRRLRRACGRAAEVVVYGYDRRAAPVWWQQTGPGLERLDNLSVHRLVSRGETALEALVARTMRLHCTIQEGRVWLGDGDRLVEIERLVLKPTA